MAFNACRPPAPIPIETPQTKAFLFTNKDGILHFEKKEDLQETLEYLYPRQKSLANWENTIGNFRSMRSAFASIPLEEREDLLENLDTNPYGLVATVAVFDEERELMRNVDCQMLATLVNENGLLQIGDVTYKFLFEYTIKVKDANQSQIEQLATFTNKDRPTFGEIEPTEREILFSTTRASDSCTDEYEDTNDNDRRKRVKGRIWSFKNSAERGFRAYTKHQRRSGFWWSADSAPWIRLEADGTFTLNFSFPATVININYDSGLLSGQSEEEETLAFCSGTCPSVEIDIDGTASARRDDFVGNVSCDWSLAHTIN